MIVKSHRDGSFYVADNGNWRLAGPFASNALAWQWIDHFRHDHSAEPENPAVPRKHVRKPRVNTSVEAADVLRVAPIIIAHAESSVKEREFAVKMKRKAERPRALRLTVLQARWWHCIARKYGGSA